MKNVFHGSRLRIAVLALATACVASATLPAVAADSVDIKVTATLVGDCTVGSTGLTLAIGDVSMSTLGSAGTASASASGTLQSLGCPGVTKVNMSFAGTASADVGYTGMFKPRTAKGVAISLESSDDGVTYTAVAPNQLKEFSPKATNAGWQFRASVVRTAATDFTAGDAGTDVVATITYL